MMISSCSKTNFRPQTMKSSLLILLFITSFPPPARLRNVQAQAYEHKCSETAEKCSLYSHHASFCADDCHAVALVGNPGTGKSTILNGLIGDSVFRSGHSFGTGLTSKLQEYKVGNVSFFDTPGLNDVSTRKQAGLEIDQLLRKNMNIKIAFVITLQSGRLNIEDSNTMHVILEAITVDTKDRFGIVVNKMTETEYDVLLNDAKTRFNLQYLITKNNRNTSHWCFVKEDKKLRNAENEMLRSNDVVKLFSALPVSKSEDAQVEDIDTDTYDEKLKDLQKEHDKKMRRLELMAVVVGLVATGAVTLNVATRQGWLLKHCNDPSSAAWIAQQLPLVVGMAGAVASSYELSSTAHTVSNITKNGFARIMEMVSHWELPSIRSFNSQLVKYIINRLIFAGEKAISAGVKHALLLADLVLSNIMTTLFIILFYISFFLIFFFLLPFKAIPMLLRLSSGEK